MTLTRSLGSTLLLAIAALLLGGCQTTRNFTTYFNLFYNMERIMDEAEEELLYIREQKAPEPTYHIAHDDQLLKDGVPFYNHLVRRSMSTEEMRANKVKLDSIVIKGSKLLGRAATSDYVDDAVYYISKSYFYQREWYQSQKKAEELIKNFPESPWLPDAHLVLAMDQLQQGNPERALTTLSRTIDVAWAYKRLDVLIDAFRLNADIHLADGNVKEALRPFERAVSLSEDEVDRARWRYEIGAVYFRNGQFEEALGAFDEALAGSPDVFMQFQARLQRAVTLRTLGRLEEASRDLAELRGNSNFESWWGLVEIEQLNVASQRGETVADSTLAAVDSAHPGRSYAAYGIYERGVRAFRDGNYGEALGHFQKVQAMNVPFQRKAQRFAQLLGQYHEQHSKATALHGYPINPFPDSVRSGLSEVYYNLARLFTTFQRNDSMEAYYKLAENWAPRGSLAAARVMFARAAMARNAGRTREADSLLEVLVEEYSMTDYAADARRQLGYTEYAKRDTAEDLYLSGTAFMRTGDNGNALNQFHRVIAKYPESQYALKSYYAIGLIYERQVENRDSAYVYYSEILNRYPLSEQAQEVRPIIDAYLGQRMRGASPPLESEVGGGGEPTDPNVTLDPQGVPRFGEQEILPLGGESPTEEVEKEGETKATEIDTKPKR
jgi:tetratricopeptide (TPR) repeat protein